MAAIVLARGEMSVVVADIRRESYGLESLSLRTLKYVPTQKFSFPDGAQNIAARAGWFRECDACAGVG